MATACSGSVASGGSGPAGTTATTKTPPPAPSVNMTLSSVGEIGVSGYCAVGKVDESAGTAKVLLENGDIVNASWTGTAPKSGMVSYYQVTDDVYTFEATRASPAYSDSFKDWQFYASGRQRRFSRTELLFTDEETTIFVRYSATEWRVFRGRQALQKDEMTSVHLYTTKELDDLAKVVDFAMVVGQCAAEGQWPPANKETTKFLDKGGVGWDEGDKDLS